MREKNKLDQSRKKVSDQEGEKMVRQDDTGLRARKTQARKRKKD